MKRILFLIILCLTLTSIKGQFIGTFTDNRDGNEYQAVKIGSQWWMAENLKATLYLNGDNIPLVQDNTNWSNQTTGAYCYYDNNIQNSIEYGNLYNWYTLIDPRELCPSSWRIPTESDWDNLLTFLGGSGIAGGKMKEAGTLHWQSPNTGATNESGFIGLPGAFRAMSGAYDHLGEYAAWWSSAEASSTSAWLRDLYNNTTECSRSTNPKKDGLAIRCVRDLYPMNLILISQNCSSIFGNDGLIDLSINGGVPPYTINWNTGNNTQDLSALYAGLYSVTVTDARDSTVNDSIRVYDTFIDTKDGIRYKAVTIGNQIWMAENLNYLPQVDILSDGSEDIINGKYYYVYDYTPTGVNEEAEIANAKATVNYLTYGVLYNWNAAMNGSETSNTIPSNIQGACPMGWHLPSDSEFISLETYLGGTSVAGGKLKEISTLHWNNPNEGATNETGFTALPGGNRDHNGYYSIGDHAFFWSSTENVTNRSLGRGIRNYDSVLLRQDWGSWAGFSVRCIKDTTTIPPALSDSLIAYYPFNGNANDESGNGNDGIVHGATLTSDRFDSIAESAYYFDGIDDYIDIGTLPELADNFGSFSFSFWINSSSEVTKQFRVIGSVNNDADGMAFGIDFHSYGSQFQFGRIALIIRCNDNKYFTFAVFAPEIFNNSWHHIVYNFVDVANNTANVYIDGKTKEIEYWRTEEPSDYGLFDNPWTIGASNTRGVIERFYEGSIDDFRIYGRPLTVNEVDSLYHENGFIEIISEIKHISCNGEDDGSITLTLIDTVNYYHFNWSTGDTTTFIASLIAGEYSVIITDSSGNKVRYETYLIPEPSELDINLSLEDISCYGDCNISITPIITGGTPPYEVILTDLLKEYNFDNLCAGTYKLIVTDANGCSKSKDLMITETDSLHLTKTIKDVSCYGGLDGSISIEITGGITPYQYLWSNGAITEDLADLTSGTYWIQVTDANNCTLTDTIYISESDPIEVELQVDSILCYGGCTPLINIIISGGTVPYEWEITPTPIDTCLKAGKYSLVIHDHNNCSVEETFTVYEPSPILINLESTNTCFNDSTGLITSDVTGGTLPYKYLWNNGNTTPDLPNLPEGIYLLTITDNNDCIATATDTVNEFPELQKVQITGHTIVNPAEIYIYSVSQKTGSVFNWIITGGNIVSGQGTNSITVQWGLPGNGKIAVIETDENLCPGDLVSLSVEISTGYSSPSMEQIRIFPNPFSNKAVIQFPNSQSHGYDLVITDLTGKVARIVGKITENSYELSRDGLPAGLYLIELRGPNIYRGKIIVE